MKPRYLLRVSLVALLAGAATMTAGCGDMISKSVKDGLLNYVVGSVSGSFDAAVFGDFITSVFTGGLGGGGRNN